VVLLKGSIWWWFSWWFWWPTTDRYQSKGE